MPDPASVCTGVSSSRPFSNRAYHWLSGLVSEFNFYPSSGLAESFMAAKNFDQPQGSKFSLAQGQADFFPVPSPTRQSVPGVRRRRSYFSTALVSTFSKVSHGRIAHRYPRRGSSRILDQHIPIWDMLGSQMFWVGFVLLFL